MGATKHFQQRAWERNFNRAMILSVLNDPDCIKPSNQPCTMKYIKNNVTIIVDERENKLITIY